MGRSPLWESAHTHASAVACILAEKKAKNEKKYESAMRWFGPNAVEWLLAQGPRQKSNFEWRGLSKKLQYDYTLGAMKLPTHTIYIEIGTSSVLYNACVFAASVF